MKAALKIMSIISIVIGGFGIIGYISDPDPWGLILVLWLTSTGIVGVLSAGKIPSKS